MDFQYSSEFERECKKLPKKYRTLDTDLLVLQKAIAVAPRGDGTKHWSKLWEENNRCVMKVRMMCRAVKGSSFRVVYIYDGNTVKIIFLEVYFKGNKENEDRERIRRYIDNF